MFRKIWLFIVSCFVVFGCLAVQAQGQPAESWVMVKIAEPADSLSEIVHPLMGGKGNEWRRSSVQVWRNGVLLSEVKKADIWPGDTVWILKSHIRTTDYPSPQGKTVSEICGQYHNCLAKKLAALNNLPLTKISTPLPANTKIRVWQDLQARVAEPPKPGASASAASTPSSLSTSSISPPPASSVIPSEGRELEDSGPTIGQRVRQKANALANKLAAQKSSLLVTGSGIIFALFVFHGYHDRKRLRAIEDEVRGHPDFGNIRNVTVRKRYGLSVLSLYSNHTSDNLISWMSTAILPAYEETFRCKIVGLSRSKTYLLFWSKAFWLWRPGKIPLAEFESRQNELRADGSKFLEEMKRWDPNARFKELQTFPSDLKFVLKIEVRSSATITEAQHLNKLGGAVDHILSTKMQGSNLKPELKFGSSRNDSSKTLVCTFRKPRQQRRDVPNEVAKS